LSSGGNPFSNFQLFILAVRVIHDHTLELDRAACDAELNALKSAFGSPDPDSVTISRAVH
jgi:hypothetical protein